MVECSVAWNYLESQPRYSAGYQLINLSQLRSHAYGYGKLIK